MRPATYGPRTSAPWGTSGRRTADFVPRRDAAVALVLANANAHAGWACAFPRRPHACGLSTRRVSGADCVRACCGGETPRGGTWTGDANKAPRLEGLRLARQAAACAARTRSWRVGLAACGLFLGPEANSSVTLGVAAACAGLGWKKDGRAPKRLLCWCEAAERTDKQR